MAFVTSAQTFTCTSGCSDYGVIGTTGYTMQYGAKMVWTANVEPGAYVVDLTFVDPVVQASKRPLNVWINDKQYLFGFDVMAAAGLRVPYAWQKTVVVPGGQIVIVLTANNTGTTPHSAIVSTVAATKIPAGGGTGPPPAQSTACRMTRTSPTLLTVNECPAQISGVFYQILGGTVAVSAGTGSARLVIDKSASPPTGKVFFSPTVQGSCAGMGGCVIAEPGSDYIADSLPVGLWTITNGTFDPLGYTPMIGTVQGFRLQSGAGLIQEQSGHTVKVRVNSDVIPIQ